MPQSCLSALQAASVNGGHGETGSEVAGRPVAAEVSELEAAHRLERAAHATGVESGGTDRRSNRGFARERASTCSPWGRHQTRGSNQRSSLGP